MRHFKSIMSALAVLAAAAMLADSCNSGKPQAIKTEIPARPAGQEDVLGLRLDPIDTVKIRICRTRWTWFICALQIPFSSMDEDRCPLRHRT